MADPFLFDAEKKLRDTAEHVAKALQLLGQDHAPWDDSLHALRLAREKLGIAAVDMAAARTHYASRMIEESFHEAGPEQGQIVDPRA